MTEQQNHLKQVLEQQSTIINEIQNLSNTLNVKKETAIKLQGIVEYLSSCGVKLPEEESEKQLDSNSTVQDVP
jgi:predicted rRNA methylase YqxC with S4 and FtsJ domains